MLQNSILQTCIITKGSKVNEGKHMLFANITPFFFFSLEVVHMKCSQVIHSVSNIFVLELIQFYSLTC